MNSLDMLAPNKPNFFATECISQSKHCNIIIECGGYLVKKYARIRWLGGWNGYAACIMDDDGPNNNLGNMGLSGEYTSERQMRKKSKNPD